MNLLSIYSIPIWQAEYPKFKEHQDLFLSAVKSYKEENKNKFKKNENSSIAGYQSPGTLQNVTDLLPLFNFICQIAHGAINDLDFIDCDIAITESWLNINDNRRAMNMEHVHSEVFSGVFYLSVPEKSGNLIFTNPIINNMWKGCSLASHKNQFTGKSIRIEPIEGNLLLFPSYLPHSVDTNDHDEERISISFNIIALPKGSIKYYKS